MKLSFNVSIIQVYYKSHPKAWYKVIQMERERENRMTLWSNLTAKHMKATPK